MARLGDLTFDAGGFGEVRFATVSELVFEHGTRAGHVAVTPGNPMKRRCEKRDVRCAAGHAGSLIDESRWFGQLHHKERCLRSRESS